MTGDEQLRQEDEFSELPEMRGVVAGQCVRCGACCRQGGPALHTPDLDLVRQGVFALADLITVRRGEVAREAGYGALEPVRREFVKIQGRPGRWSCKFYEAATHACRIYDHRPLSCRAFRCWDPRELLDLQGKELLDRQIILGDDPMQELVATFESRFPLPPLDEVAAILKREEERPALLAKLESACRYELLLRQELIEAHRLPLAEELFYLGRPLFRLLAPLGVVSRFQDETLSLVYEPAAKG